MKKVVITGIGAISSIGLNAEDFWNGLITGKNGAKRFTRVSPENHDSTVAAEVSDDFEQVAAKYWKKRQLNATTTAVRMGLAATSEAIEDSGLDKADIDKSRVSVIHGVIDNSFEDYELEKKLNITLKKMSNELPALVSIRYGFTGPSFNVGTACASSAYALAIGKQFIDAGLSDIVITGGISNTVTDLVISGFNQLLAMSVNPDPDTAARPFTKNRDGFVLGEGGGSLVIETEESAKARGAKIYCELAGASMCSEAFNITAPQADGAGMATAIRLALENAGISTDEVDYINAHGTSTGLNDLYETLAIKDVFGKRAYDIPVSSIKASIGHTLGASGALEAIATVKAIETGILPPTIHYDIPDPELDLNYVPNAAQKHNVNVALSNSFGFGGHNATLVFRKYTP